MLTFLFADQCTHLFVKATAPTFLQTQYTVKTKIPTSETTMESGFFKSRSQGLLLYVLDELPAVDLKKFQWFLAMGNLEDFPPIPRSWLEGCDRVDTVDVMVERYGTDGAVRITTDILEKIGQVHLSNKLQSQCRPYTVPPAPKDKTAPKLPPEFLLHFRSELVYRMGHTEHILDALLVRGVLSGQEMEAIAIYATRVDKNRALVDMIRRKGNEAQEVFYKVLREVDPYLLEDLEGHPSPATEELPKAPSQIMITPEAREEANMYRLDCPRAGVYHCDITGLVLEGEGEVAYCTIPWDKEFLSSKGKRPAGPMFKFKHIKGSFTQLHLPHCETFSDGKRDDLSVVHVTDDKVEFIQPKTITDKYVIINITGFCKYGLVKDDSPTDSDSPINGMVVVFYQATNDPDLYPSLHVLLLPRNALIKLVQQEWRTTDGMEYIRVPPDCQLIPNQTYKLSGQPTKLIQPEMAKFLNFASYDNYTASFEVQVAPDIKNVELSLKLKRRNHWSWRLFFGQEYVEVWRRDAKLRAAPPLGTAAGRMELSDGLLRILKSLKPIDLATFKRRLTQCPDPLLIGDLADADCMDIVYQMVEKYMDGAKDKAIEILKWMNCNSLAEDLQRS